MATRENIDQNFPEDWAELVKEAMKSNSIKEEFKKFLKEKSKNNENKSVVKKSLELI